jgi:acetyl-CoA C-acetyltransferase
VRGGSGTPELPRTLLCALNVGPDISPEDPKRLRPAFGSEGTVTAGNASGINDAAAAVVLASGSFVNRNGLTPLGRLAGYGHPGVEPRIMGLGPGVGQPARSWP